jgi:hypothetical protein
MGVSSVGAGLIWLGWVLVGREMVQRVTNDAFESGGKSWQNEISITPRPAPDEMPDTKKRRLRKETAFI